MDFKEIWNHAWGHVLGGLIIGAGGLVWAVFQDHPGGSAFGIGIIGLGVLIWFLFNKLWSIKLTVTHFDTSYYPKPGIGYPLKYYIEMRNDSGKSIEVSVVKFQPKNIRLKSFPTEVMQVRFHAKWFPSDESVDKVAVYPGQLCRAWIGVNESEFTEQQVKAAVGRIGTLTVSANKKQIPIDL